MLQQLHFQEGRVTEELVKDVIKQHLRYAGDSAYTIALFDGFGLAMGLTTPDAYGAFAGIPFGIIWSEKDMNQYPDAPPAPWVATYKATIPGIEERPRLPNCGHNALLDCSAAAAKAVMAHIDEHPTPAPTDMGTTD